MQWNMQSGKRTSFQDGSYLREYEASIDKEFRALRFLVLWYSSSLLYCIHSCLARGRLRQRGSHACVRSN